MRLTRAVCVTPPQDPTLAAWLEHEKKACHVHVGPLSPAAARELICANAPHGVLPEAVLSYTSLGCGQARQPVGRAVGGGAPS